MKNSFLYFLLLSFSVSFAQERIEVPLSSASNLVRVVNLKEKGIVQLDKSSNGLLKVRKFDNNLLMVWETEVDLNTKLNFLEEYVDNNFIYLLLDNRFSEKLTVLKISTSFAATQKYEINSIRNLEVNHFQATDNLFLIGGVVKKDPVLIFFEPTSSVPRFVSANLKGSTSLQSVDIANNSVFASFLNQSKRKTEAVFREFSFSGKLVNSTIIKSKPEFQLLTTNIFNVDDQKILVGNYGFSTNRSEDFSSSQGIYIVDLAKPDKIKYYSFDTFKNFFGFLNERQKERLEKQVSKKKKRGGEYKFNYRLFISDIAKQGNNIVITTEVFNPEFRSNNNSPFFGGSSYGYNSFWGRNYLNSYWSNNPALWGYNGRSNQIFDGFRYIEGFVMSLNSKGDLLWDNSVQYKNLKYYDLKPHFKVSIQQGYTLGSYVRDNKLNVVEYKPDGEVLSNLSLDKSQDEKSFRSRNAEFENFDFWYGNYFYNWGMVKNTNNDTNRRLNIFIQKVPF